MYRALLVTLMCFVAVSHGSMQTRNASDGPWSGWVRCELSAQLNEQGRSYLNQQTHTWMLTAATPTSGTDIKEYPATWTVEGGGTGQRQEGNGRTVADKWNTAGQPMPTTISFRVDLTGALFIALRGPQLASVGATTGQSVARSSNGNAPDQQTSIRLNVEEYRFPLIRDDATKTSIANSSAPVAIGNIAPGQPPRTVSTAACTWNLVRGGQAPPPPPSSSGRTGSELNRNSTGGAVSSLPTNTPPPAGAAAPTGRAGSELGRTNTGTPTPLPTSTTTNPADPGNLVGTSAKWWGWARCTLTTTGPDQYNEQQTHTWTLSGAAPTVAEATTATYPATWSLSVRGYSARNMGVHPGSLAGGDVEYREWSTDVGRAAPIAASGSIGSPRVSFTAAHAPLQEVVTVTRIIANPDGTQVSQTQLGNLAVTIGETAFPLIQASGTRISGSSAPAAVAPAGFSSTKSCSWLLDNTPLLTADAPPPPPRTRSPLPPNIAQALLDLQKVRVLSPNGSEDWAMNTARTVVWEHKLGAGKRFDIDLSVDGGIAWVSLARNVADDGSGSRGSYVVMLPRYGSVAALIRVSPAGDIQNGDVSDGGFTLQDAWLRLDAPNGETVRFGGTANFRVYTNLASDRYTIEISYNSGQNWTRLAESEPSSSTFIVPRTTQTNNGFAQVRATSNTVPTLRALGSLRVVY